MTARTFSSTGGSRGIGAAVARPPESTAIASPSTTRAAAKRPTRLVAEIRAMGGKAVAIKGDVSNHDDVVRMFDHCRGQLGPLTALVNNAGITGKSSRSRAGRSGSHPRLHRHQRDRRHFRRTRGRAPHDPAQVAESS